MRTGASSARPPEATDGFSASRAFARYVPGSVGQAAASGNTSPISPVKYSTVSPAPSAFSAAIGSLAFAATPSTWDHKTMGNGSAASPDRSRTEAASLGPIPPPAKTNVYVFA